MTNTMRTTLVSAIAFCLLAIQPASAQDATSIELTQTGCQFVEAEHGKDLGYVTKQKSDCEAINSQSGDERVSKAKTIRLKPGRYVFRVTRGC